MCIRDSFNNEILPLLSPQIVGKKHPFPFLKNKEIYVLVNLETKRAGSVKIGIIPCNNGVFKRLIPMPGTKGSFMLIEELILNYVSKVFGGYRIKEKAVMRVIRNADIDTDEGDVYKRQAQNNSYFSRNIFSKNYLR